MSADGRELLCAMAKVWGSCVLCALAIACTSSTSQQRTDATAGEEPSAGDGGGDGSRLDNPVDEFGYSIVGENVFPPLYQRVEAKCVEAVAGAPSECTSDDDCGPGFACLCGYQQGRDLGNQCVAAECRMGADCEGGKCLLSWGSLHTECCGYGRPSLVCNRPGSTCQHGGDCVGNGVACIYDKQLDYFQCKPLTCACGD